MLILDLFTKRTGGKQIIGEKAEEEKQERELGEVMYKARSWKKRGCTNGGKRENKSQISSHFGKPYAGERPVQNLLFFSFQNITYLLPYPRKKERAYVCFPHLGEG